MRFNSEPSFTSEDEIQILLCGWMIEKNGGIATPQRAGYFCGFCQKGNTIIFGFQTGFEIPLEFC